MRPGVQGSRELNKLKEPEHKLMKCHNAWTKHKDQSHNKNPANYQIHTNTKQNSPDYTIIYSFLCISLFFRATGRTASKWGEQRDYNWFGFSAAQTWCVALFLQINQVAVQLSERVCTVVLLPNNNNKHSMYELFFKSFLENFAQEKWPFSKEFTTGNNCVLPY